MRQSGRTSSWRKARRRGALGLFAAVWLNLALAPCAMAYQADADHDCPHCPPQAAMPAHHHDMHGSMHEPAQAKTPCIDGLSNCSLDGDYSYDARGAQPKLKDVQIELPAAAVHAGRVTHPVCTASESTPPGRPAALQAGAAPPLYLLNCAFLD